MLYSVSSAVYQTDRTMKFDATRMSELCNQKGISEAELARRIGVAAQTISRYKGAEHRDPTPEILVKMAKELETTTDYLLGIAEDPKPSGGLTEDEWAILQEYRTRRLALQREIIDKEIAELDNPIRDAIRAVIGRTLKVQRKLDTRRNNP